MYSSYAVAAATCSIIFPALAIIAVCFRLQARKIKSLAWGADDYLVLVALAFSIAEACIVLYGSSRAGIGQALSTMTPNEFKSYQKHLYFDVIVAHLAIGTTKLSVVSLYKRIFTTARFRFWANVVMVFCVLWTLGATLTQIFSAWPISRWWTLQAGYNLDYGAFITSFAAIDIAIDVVVLSMPIPVIKNLHMSRQRKFTVIGIFWLGGFCLVSAAVRLYFAYELSPKKGNKNAHPTDAHFSYISVNNVIWSLIEPCISIVAACLPTLGPIVKPSFSLRSLARSLRSRTLNRSAEASSRKSTQSSDQERWSESRTTSQGPWSPLPDGNEIVTYRADTELGDVRLPREAGLLPTPVAKPEVEAG